MSSSSLSDSSFPKQQCSELYPETFSVYTLTITNHDLNAAIHDTSKPISMFMPILNEYLETVISGIIDKKLKNKEQLTISLNHEAVIIDTDQQDVTTVFARVGDLFSETIEHSRKEVLGTYLKTCNIPIKSICGTALDRYYFVFMIYRYASPLKMVFLGYHKLTAATPDYILVSDLVRELKDQRITTAYSQQKKKEMKTYKKKVVLFSI